MPSFKSASIVRFFFGGYSPGTHTTSIGVRLAIDALDPTTITDGAERATAGMRNDQAEWAGLFNNAAQALYNAEALVGTGTHVVSVHMGTAAGDPAYLGTAFLLSKPNVFNIKELVREEAEFRLDGTWQTGTVLYPKTSGTGNATGTAVNFGAVSTGTYSGYVHVFALNTGTINVIFESATTATGAYTLHASANITSAQAPTGTLVTSTATINAWHRFRFTNTVATATWDIAAAAART